MMREVFDDVFSAAEAAASRIAAGACEAVRARGVFTFAVSGGETPWIMLRELVRKDVPWQNVHIFQVDERVAADRHPDRNLTHLRESLLNHVPLPADHVHPMPVTSTDLETAAASYARTLHRIAGSPAVLDLVHLGLGQDGHTASLVPEDPVLEITDRDVALTGVYQSRYRMTLTCSVLSRARKVLWVVTGKHKAEMLRRLCEGDRSIPAGHIDSGRALLIADRAATGYPAAEQSMGA